MPKRLNGAASDQRATRVESRFLLILLTAPELFQAVHKPCRACWLLERGTKERGDGWSSNGARPSILCLVCPRGALVGLGGRWFHVKKISSQQPWALAEAGEVGCRQGVGSLFFVRGASTVQTVLCEEGRNADLAVLTSGPFFAVAGCSPMPSSSLGEKRDTHAACRVSALPLVPLALLRFSFAPYASHIAGCPARLGSPSSRAATPAVRVRYLLSKDHSPPGVPSSV